MIIFSICWFCLWNIYTVLCETYTAIISADHHARWPLCKLWEHCLLLPDLISSPLRLHGFIIYFLCCLCERVPQVTKKIEDIYIKAIVCVAEKPKATGGGHWDFRFCGFGYFLDRFFGFCCKRLRFFGFGGHCGLWIFRFLASGFRFSWKILAVFRFWYPMWFFI